MLGEIRVCIVPKILAEARRMGVSAEWLSAEDVLHTAIVRLTEADGRAARYVAAAKGEPWWYLERCMRNWAREQWGTCCAVLDEATTVSVSATESAEGPFTPMSTALDHTRSVLEPYVAPRLRPYLPAVLRWLALNPPQRRSYEANDLAAGQARFSMFSEREFAAVANAVWGARPRYRETSILAAFLLDEAFRVSDSPSHARAMLRFRRTMTSRGTSKLTSGLRAAA